MKFLTVVALLLHFLLVAQSAPISWFQPPAAFTEASERAKTLLEKILRDIPAVHAAAIHIQGLTLDPPTQTTDLQLMAATLGLPAAPVLKPPSEHFTLDLCVSRMLAGSWLYQGLLGVLSDRLSGLSDLRADLRDLHTHISKMKEAAQLDAGVPDQNQSLELGSRLEGDYNTQVALHLTLTRLRSFCHDLSRSLRAVATYRLRAAAAR